MQAFNLTRLNLNSPYKIWIRDTSYIFVTDYGVQYRIEFSQNQDILLYQCETGDNRQAYRQLHSSYSSEKQS